MHSKNTLFLYLLPIIYTLFLYFQELKYTLFQKNEFSGVKNSYTECQNILQNETNELL